MHSRIFTVGATVETSEGAFLGARAAALPRDLAAKASYLSTRELERDGMVLILGSR